MNGQLIIADTSRVVVGGNGVCVVTQPTIEFVTPQDNWMQFIPPFVAKTSHPYTDIYLYDATRAFRTDLLMVEEDYLGSWELDTTRLPCRLILDLGQIHTIQKIRIMNQQDPTMLTQATKNISMYTTTNEPQLIAGTDISDEMALFRGDVPLNNGLEDGQDFFYPPIHIRSGRYLVVDIHTSYDPDVVGFRHIGVMTL